MLRLALLSQRRAELFHDLPVKGGSQRRSRWIADRLDAFVDAQVVAFPLLLPQAVGAVAHHDGRNAQTPDLLGLPEIPAGAERSLFLQCHLRQNLFYIIHRMISFLKQAGRLAPGF